MKILVYFWKGKIAPRPGKEEEEEGKKRSVFGIDKEAGDLTIVAQFKDQTTRLKNIDKVKKYCILSNFVKKLTE